MEVEGGAWFNGAVGRVEAARRRRGERVWCDSLEPNTITLAGSELVREPDSVMELSF